MSKRVSLLFIILLVLSVVVFASCSASDVQENTEQPKVTATPENKPEEGSGIEDSIFDEGMETGGENSGVSEPSGNSSTEKPSGVSPTASPDIQQGAVGTPEGGSATAKPSDPSTPTVDTEMDYETFKSMSPADQRAFMESFDDMDAFFDWYNVAQKKYQEENPSIEIDGGVIDLDKVVNGK